MSQFEAHEVMMTWRVLIVATVIACTPAQAASQGEALFFRNWTSAESDTDGLGPLFNEASCHACHWFGGGARITQRASGEVAAAGVLVRLTDVAGRGDPVLGLQLHNKAVRGGTAEGRVHLSRPRGGPDDLFGFALRLRLEDGLELAPGIIASLRAAPALDAAGIVAMVSDRSILSRADPADRDGDGISGRPHLLARPGARPRTGRFGWKATQSRITDQIATAFWFDMGLTTTAYPHPRGDCAGSAEDCAAPADARPDVEDEELAKLADYVRSLARDERRATPVPPATFTGAGCGACHVPVMRGNGNEAIELYSDVLLHDMGEGLSSGGAEGAAAAREWRTTPLVGWRGKVAGQRFLHDGRAATIDEAIRWHGGEAAAARDAYMAMNAAEKLQLTRFVLAIMSSMPLPAKLQEE